MMPAADVKRREALALLDAQAWEKARLSFQEILQSGGSEARADAQVWFGLARAWAGSSNSEESDKALTQAYDLAPKNPPIASAVADRLIANSNTEQAINVLKRALFAVPDDIELLSRLADAYELERQFSAALKVCAKLAKLAPGNALPHLKAGRIRTLGSDYAGAEQEFRAAVAAEPNNAFALDNLSTILRAMGRVDEARDVLARRAGLDQDRAAVAIARFKAATTQPVVPRNQAEIDESRGRLAAALAAGPGSAIEDPFRAGLGPNFFLNYQAQNDRALHEAFAAYYLAATPSLNMVAPHVGRSAKGRRIRVGILTAYFSDQTVGYLTYGLALKLDRERFDVVLLRPSHAPQDAETRRFRAGARLVDLPNDFAAARAAIAAEELDILHFPEIGMDHFTYFIAFARLATVQSVAWGHPVTTGLPHMDLFTSVADMEPEGGERHYSETLVRFKSLSFAAERPPEAAGDRAQAGLEPGPAYVCLQSLCKVHPQFDDVLARILAGDSKGHIYFISNGAYADGLLTERLAGALGSDISRVKVLPRMLRPGFLNLAAAADVALDVPQWSGGKTSLETFAMGTPIVHMPGEFMRGRHTLAFYRRMGMTAPVVNSAADYARTAVRLANDADFRAEIRGQIKETQSTLFEDWASVREFEEVWTNALAART
jgi:predicted O-linked N-acetylglucosamine transferase (SPINDLY family)